MHGFERILGALDVALERVGFGALDAGARRRHALAFHLDQQVGEPALDRAEMVEARVGGVELLDQPHDPVFEMVDRGLVGAAGVQLIDLVGEAPHHRFEAGASPAGTPRDCCSASAIAAIRCSIAENASDAVT